MTDSKAGRFAWYDLMTTDPTAAVAFYTKVVGYTTREWAGGGKPYTMWVAGEAPVGGVTELPDQAKEMGAPPHWLGYVHVGDIAASTAQVTALGGQVFLPPTEIPTVGHFSVVADPTGAVLALFQEGSQPMTLRAGDAVGEFSWHELMTSDPESAFGFYSALFGWQKTDAMDMGPMGVYQMYGISGKTLGGYMKTPPTWQGPSAWLYYANVEKLSTSVEAIKMNGGTIVMGPHQVPGGDWIVTGTDPQGAFFALFSKTA